MPWVGFSCVSWLNLVVSHGWVIIIIKFDIVQWTLRDNFSQAWYLACRSDSILVVLATALDLVRWLVLGSGFETFGYVNGCVAMLIYFD